MCNQDRTDDFLRKANRAYANGDFGDAEEHLLHASGFKGISEETRATIFDNLAVLACERGNFSSAAYWYQKVLGIRSHQYPLGNAKLKDTIRNYKLLLSICQSKAQLIQSKRTA